MYQVAPNNTVDCAACLEPICRGDQVLKVANAFMVHAACKHILRRRLLHSLTRRGLSTAEIASLLDIHPDYVRQLRRK